MHLLKGKNGEFQRIYRITSRRQIVYSKSKHRIISKLWVFASPYGFFPFTLLSCARSLSLSLFLFRSSRVCRMEWQHWVIFQKMRSQVQGRSGSQLSLTLMYTLILVFYSFLFSSQSISPSFFRTYYSFCSQFINQCRKSGVGARNMTMRRRRSQQKRSLNEARVARRRYVTLVQKVLFTGEAFLGSRA